MGGKLERQSRVSQKSSVNCPQNTFTLPYAKQFTFKVCYYALYVFKNRLIVSAVVRNSKAFSDREAFPICSTSKTKFKKLLLITYMYLQSHLGYFPLLLMSELGKIITQTSLKPQHQQLSQNILFCLRED